MDAKTAPTAEDALRAALGRMKTLEAEMQAALDLVEAAKDPFEDVRSYSLTELSKITGTPRSTLDAACQKSQGDLMLRSFIPNGNKQGRRVTMPWYRDWQERCKA